MRITISRRWLMPAVGFVMAAAILFWLYRGIDVGLFLSALGGAEIPWIFALAATILLEQLIRAWKWRQILFDLRPIATFRLFGAVIAGYAMTTLIPLGISPLVRAWLVARLEGLRLASVLITTAIERFLDGIVFALIAALVALAGQFPTIEGDVRGGLIAAGALNLVLFGGLMCLVFLGRQPLRRDSARISRLLDWLAKKAGPRFQGLREAITDGIVWPQARWRQVAAISASIAMKVVSTTHFLWAGLAIGVLLAPWDYPFLMVFAGFALVLARFVRVPGGFIIGTGLALDLLGVLGEQALAMIVLNNALSISLIISIGLASLWRSGIQIGTLRKGTSDVARE